MTQPILQLQGLSMVYGTGGSAVHALTDVSFSLPAGSFTALVGRSGSGKSTLLDIAGGLLAPTAGSVRLCGEELYALSDSARTVFRRRKVGYVFQFFDLLPELTVLENICLPLRLDGRRLDAALCETLLQRLGLTALRQRTPSQLSGGEQQRVAVARALALRPALLLADEPTGNLDRRSGDELVELLVYCRRAFAQTVLLVTHDLDIARRAQRILTLEDGRIVGDARGAEG